MEIWTRQRDQLGWTPWPDVPRGLASLLDAPDEQVLLLSEAPDVERDLLVAAIRVVRALARNGGHVVVASSHPFAGLLDELTPPGVDQLWVVERHEAKRKATIENVSEIGGGICPNLHTKTENGTTLSVCGRRHDRMVLARHHLDRWCLMNPGGCPHRDHGGGDA